MSVAGVACDALYDASRCYDRRMRTTVNLDDDVATAVTRLRRESGVGQSEALNELARRGMSARPDHPAFRQRTADLGPGIDIRDVAEALEIAEGPAHR